MPDNEVRIKYGLADSSNEPSPMKPGSQRDYAAERSTLLSYFERLCRYFLHQLVNGQAIVDNNTRNAEEFCALIEACLDHGFKWEPQGLINKRISCFWTILENYDRKKDAADANQSAFEIVKKHLSLPNDKSKLRAWIRMALTKKVLKSEIRESLRAVKHIERCYFEWAFLRSDAFGAFLTAVDSLSQVDFNFVVKEHLLNLSDKNIKWRALIDPSGLHLEAIAPYLRLEFDKDFDEAEMGDLAVSADRRLIRQIGFLEDENVRLRKSVLFQMNENSVLERRVAELEQEVQQLKRQLDQKE